MKLYTSYYANIKNIPEDYILVSISGGITEDIKNAMDIHDKRFAPNLSLFTEYKNSPEGINREVRYVKRFKKEILENRDINEILKSWTDKFGYDKKYVMLCYEKPEDFCHRHIVAEAIENKYNIEINELGLDLKTYKIEDYKSKPLDEINLNEW